MFGIMILNTYLLRGGNVELGAGTSYAITYMQVTAFALNTGFNITL